MSKSEKETKEVVKATTSTKAVIKFDKDQFLGSGKYSIGQKAFIASIADKEFPLSIEELNKRLGVK